MPAKGIWNHVRRATFLSIFAGVTWVAGPPMAQHYAQQKEEQLSDKNLEAVLMEEGNKLGMTGQITIYRGDRDTSSSGLLSDGTYFIFIDKGHENRSIIRHELYHIADGHVDDAQRVIKEYGEWGFQFFYKCIYEPQAVIYSVFDIKL